MTGFPGCFSAGRTRRFTPRAEAMMKSSRKSCFSGPRPMGPPGRSSAAAAGASAASRTAAAINGTPPRARGRSDDVSGQERRPEQGVGAVVVREAHLRGVPLQLLAREADGDVAQEADLGERAAVLEVRAGRAVLADRFQPVPVVVLVLDPRDLLLRLVLLHAGIGDE